jgi:hypothetical protein
MKFSTEAIVALAVAVVFVLLSLGVIAREQGQGPASRMHNAFIANNANLSPVAASETDSSRLLLSGTHPGGIAL